MKKDFGKRRRDRKNRHGRAEKIMESVLSKIRVIPVSNTPAGAGGLKLRHVPENAVLIGETLMRAADKKAKLRELKGKND